MSGVPNLDVRPIGADTHLGFVRERGSASFLQTPAWAAVKAEWRSASLGWYAGSDLVGAALVLFRDLPRIPRSLAYMPEGPLLDWSTEGLADRLDPMVRHLKKRGAFAVRIGPPVITRRWSAQQVKDGVADPGVRLLGDVAPTERSAEGARVVSQLRASGWRPQFSDGGGFAAGQPRYNFWLPLDRSEEEILAGMNQLWRRNIRKAAKAGVEVTGHDGRDVTPAQVTSFHTLYAETAVRDRFTPRPASYFTTMLAALGAEEPDRIRLYLARHDGDLVAATIAIRVGTHSWYSYGASSTAKREVRGSNAVQWQMIRDARAAGARVYDLRGITDTLDVDDPHVGLIQFKVGTGGEAVEYAGEWDLPISRPLYKAFDLYMSRRGG